MAKVDYSNPIPPQEYKCDICGATGVKLWRDDDVQLYCAVDAAQKEGVPVESIDEQGYRIDQFGHETDQLGRLSAAVPTEDGRDIWGYTSVPQAGVDWWENLPTVPEKK